MVGKGVKFLQLINSLAGQPLRLDHGIIGAEADQGRAIALANKIARMAWAMMSRVSGTRNPSRLRRNEIALDIRRDVKVGRRT
jgi:hypothetical protein